MFLGIATRPSPVPSSPLDRVVVSTTSPPRSSPPRRPPPATRRACRRSIVSPQSLSPALRCTPPLPSPALAAAHRAARPPSSRLSPSPPCHRVVVVRAEADRRALGRCRRGPARRRPSSSSRAPRSALVVCASSPPRRRRSLSVVVATVIAAFAVIVAAVLVVNTLGHGSRCRCGRPRRGLRRHLRPRALSVMFAAIGRRLSSFGRHRRPPPVAAVVVVDPRLYPHPWSCSATLPPASLTWDWDVTRRRRRVVVVLAAALWSSSSSGLVLPAAGWQCFDVGAGQGTDQT